MLAVVTALLGMTLSSWSFAASAASNKQRSPTKAQPAHKSAAHPSAAQSKSKPKVAVAQHPAQHRKTPAKSRIAAKSKTPARAHQPPRQPAKLAAKQTKHTA
jgi:hypothetical protein